jgi:hypothetical protein
MMPPPGLIIRLVWAMLRRQKMDFGDFARTMIQRMEPPLQVSGLENFPAGEPCVITVNHYSQAGFQAWWMAVAISASIQVDVHWVMSAAWTTPARWKAWWWTPLTGWTFQRLADVFDFITMPPMPPNPRQVEVRAQAVRRVLRLARDSLAQPGGQPPAIGLAPEGGDMLDGKLTLPPSGAGRFIQQLATLGLWISPVGVYFDVNGLCLNFGKAYRPEIEPGVSRAESDRWVSRQVMDHIAELMPYELRGEFG